MRILVTLGLLISFLISGLKYTCCQQCQVIREITSCSDEEEHSFSSPSNGLRGKPGPPGKAGPRGSKGDLGPRGLKGDVGPVPDMEDFVQEIKDFVQELNETLNRKLQEMRRNLSNLQTHVEEQQGLRDCASSGRDGMQTLRSGEKIFCSGGWTVFQRRDGSIRDFHLKTWEEYSAGFGVMTGEFWLGLRKLHNLTKNGGCTLRVDLWSWEDEHAYEEFSAFSVASEDDLYRVTVDCPCSGTAGIGFADKRHSMSQMAFSTSDRDNDLLNGNCAGSLNRGGWWHRRCGYANPNAVYGRSKGTWNALVWDHWKKLNSLKSAELKLRCD